MPGLLNIGIASGSKRSQMLCLKTDSAIALVVGNWRGATGGTGRLSRRRIFG